jgi:hypothetical protein
MRTNRRRDDPQTNAHTRPAVASSGATATHRRRPNVRRARAAMRTSLCAAALSSLLAAAPAPAHMIDVRRATDAVTSQAANLGHVERAKCWRPALGTRRARHRAVCMAWVHTPQGLCATVYDVRIATHPTQHLQVTPTHKPWCGWPADLGDGSLTRL